MCLLRACVAVLSEDEEIETECGKDDLMTRKSSSTPFIGIGVSGALILIILIIVLSIVCKVCKRRRYV